MITIEYVLFISVIIYYSYLHISAFLNPLKKKKKKFNNDLKLKLQSCCYTEEIIAQFIVSVGGIGIWKYLLQLCQVIIDTNYINEL